MTVLRLEPSRHTLVLDGGLTELSKACVGLDLEGIVVKRERSVYRTGGRTKALDQCEDAQVGASTTHPGAKKLDSSTCGDGIAGACQSRPAECLTHTVDGRITLLVPTRRCGLRREGP